MGQRNSATQVPQTRSIPVPVTPVDIRTFINRMIRAAKLDVQLYEEVEADQSATGQAMAVVVLSALAAGIGTIGVSGGYGQVLLGTISAVMAWFVWAFLTYWIGTRLLPEPQTEADLGQLLRTIGFSSAPGLIRILGIFPGLMPTVMIVSLIWMLIAMVIAVRQALDYQSTGRAIGVCAIGWGVQIIVRVFISPIIA